jgi:cellulose biosynthesis protein BcsQ
MQAVQSSPNAGVVFADSDSGGVIHVANIKGGVGKSTVATNLAAVFAAHGPTLIIDLDVQGSATHALGKDPSEFSRSSWHLLNNRYAINNDHDETSGLSWKSRAVHAFKQFESRILNKVVGYGAITQLCVPVSAGMDLIPAGSDLFRHAGSYHIRNLIYNIEICRTYYKYIVIDTPSVWNHLTKSLFLNSDLNLVPVTLNALSTRSLRDYLVNVRRMARKNSSVRVRIVKNEVFGTQSSKIKGKTRTMSENRRFLEQLCEQTVIRTPGGVSVLPQSILLDMEIPESAIVRDAQDEGMSVHEYHQYSPVTRAFEELARRVQEVLDNQASVAVPAFWPKWEKIFIRSSKLAGAFAAMALFMLNPPVMHARPPRPVAPQQLVKSDALEIHHRISDGESIYKIAKYAICHFRAVVPSPRMVSEYADEIVTIFNRTRLDGESQIAGPGSIIPGTLVTLYPPSGITNPREDELRPVYNFFTSLVDDPYAYITGDWCERGTGGGKPHYGIDVAAPYGTGVFSPIDGKAVLHQNEDMGRTIGVEKNGAIIFFSHCDKRYLKNGDPVSKGQMIATIGMTGRTSGPHSHIGYGIKAPSGGVAIGKNIYKVTDPKLFFYHEQYMKSRKHN